MTQPVIGFAGMTHLGLVSATAIAAKGFPTVCYDGNAALIAAIDRGELPVAEPDLDATVAANRPRQSFTADPAGLAGCDVVYIAADVPTDDTGSSDLTGIRALIDRVAQAMAPDAILVVLCQVPPGFTRALPLPPERLYYQVETLVFGRALERAAQPERYIVGCADPEQPLPPAYGALLRAFGCPVLPMRYESAELAKIAINMCLVASISVANTLAELCERIGAVWSEIAPSLRLDRRIGQHAYLAPGLGIAGGNLERDLATVIRLAGAHGTDAGVVEAWVANSRHRRNWAAETLRRVRPDLGDRAAIAVWGLAYKENTHSVKNSPSLATIAQLRAGYRLCVHDPVVPAEAAAYPGTVGAASPIEAADGAEVLMILTPWPLYRSVAPAALAKVMAGRTVIDPYAVLDRAAVVAAGLDYHTLGAPPALAARTA